MGLFVKIQRGYYHSQFVTELRRLATGLPVVFFDGTASRADRGPDDRVQRRDPVSPPLRGTGMRRRAAHPWAFFDRSRVHKSTLPSALSCHAEGLMIPDSRFEPAVTRPAKCPQCDGKAVDTLAKVMTPTTVWRCRQCDHTWTIASQRPSPPPR